MTTLAPGAIAELERQPAHVALDAVMTEAELQEGVMQMARAFRWLAYHTHDSRRSPAGFPDCVLARPPRLVFAELKRQKGQTTPEQEAWLAALREVGQAVEAYVWRPADWSSGEIEEVLR